ncbi:MAG: tetratricopeptide repeat protein [Clostridiales bacterium]|nr:tetratricopeptide repeat protein [Clostridiales bacterium]
MRKKKAAVVVIGLLALAFMLTFASCQKLNVNRLRANYHFSKANHFFESGKFSKAISEYENTLKYNPAMVDAYRFLGESHKSRYKPHDESADNLLTANKALEALTKAYEFDPTNKQVIYSLGDMYDRMRNFESAEKYYLKILELEPTNMDNYYVVAEFYKRYAGEKQELKSKVEAMYLRRIELDPETPQAYAYMANYYDMITPVPDFDKALEFQKRRLELDPDNAEIYYTIGVNRFSKGYRLQNILSLQEREKLGIESEKALLKAAEIDPSYPDTYAYINLVHRNIFAHVYPERASRHVAEADRWLEKFQEIRKRAMEKARLEKELARID